MDEQSAPAPFIEAHIDVSDLDGFMLNVERLLASELVAIGTPEECWAAFMLWCRAWKQLPGGSLPNDDRVLASFSGAGRRWPKVRANALHGFVLCSDNRYYHRFLCTEVMRAYDRKVAYRSRRETDKKRLSEWRTKRNRNEDETRFDAEDTGQGQGQGQGQKKGSEPDGSAEAAIDLKALVFRTGLRWLMDNTGKTEPQARSVLGGWCKEFGDGAVIEAIAAGTREKPQEPVAWIVARLKSHGKSKARAGPTGGYIPMHPGAGG